MISDTDQHIHLPGFSVMEEWLLIRWFLGQVRVPPVRAMLGRAFTLSAYEAVLVVAIFGHCFVHGLKDYNAGHGDTAGLLQRFVGSFGCGKFI